MKQLLLFLLFCISFYSVSSQSIVFVDQDALGSSDGSSWINAYTDLHLALTNSNPGDTLFLKAGTYTVSTEMEAFVIDKHLSVIGGFEGSETSSSHNNPDDNITILSGDRNGDDEDGNRDLNKSDNALHVIQVLTGPRMVYLEGITIKGGYSAQNGELGDAATSGAGLIGEGRMLLYNVVFLDNSATFGGGAHILSGSYLAEFIWCKFMNNNASTFGGGIYAGASGTNLRVIDSEFINNYALQSGGGILCGGIGSTASIENSDFLNNISGFGGAGLQCDTDGNIWIYRCDFNENRARFGAGLRIQGGAIALVSESNFNSNVAQRTEDSEFTFGGGVHVVTNAKANFTSCDFDGNSSSLSGAALSVGINSEVGLSYGILSNNQSGFGGAVSVYNKSRITSVQNVYQANTVLGAELGNIGGAVYGTDSSFVRLDGDIFIDNEGFDGGAVYVSTVSNLEVVSSTFEQNTADFGGAVFVNTESSACIHGSKLNNNRGNSFGGAMYVWQEGYAIIDDCEINENSAEFGAGAIHFDNGNHSSIRNTTFQSNLTSNVEFTEIDGGAIYQNNTNLTIMDSRFEQNRSEWRGGAIFSLGTYTLKISGSDFIKNTSYSNGGGLAAEQGGTLDIWESNFIENESFFGGGLCAFGDISMRIAGCIFDGNLAQIAAGLSIIGGADESKLNYITSSQFLRNRSVDLGFDNDVYVGAINQYNAHLLVENSVFYDNYSALGGSAIFGSDAGEIDNPLTLRNNTFANNVSDGGATININELDATRGHVVFTQNNIFDNDSPNFEIFDAASSLTSHGGNVSSSDDTEFLTHSSDLNEQEIAFNDKENGDLTLSDESPAVNAGTLPASTEDILGNPRVGAPDAGAYENQNVENLVFTESRSVNGIDLLITPNPVSENMRVILPSTELVNPDISLVDMEGKVIRLNAIALKSTQFVEYNIGHLSAGSYILQLSDDGVLIGQKRFVKQ